MTWARFDDQFPIHRKVAPLDDASFRLQVEAVIWCLRNTTDGHIAVDELTTISARATKPRVAKLIDRGLWHAAGYECPSPKCPATNGAGWVIHDYLEYQPTKEKVKAELAAKAERTRLWREKRAGGKKGGDTSGDASRDGTGDASGDASSDASPSPPRPAPKEGGAGAPQRQPAASGGRAASGVESAARTSPPCPTCANALDSPYHRNACGAA